MVETIKIGVIGVQGAVSEHIDAMQKCMDINGIRGKTFLIKSKKQISNADALILPGGESTTISRFLFDSGFHNEIIKKVEENKLPIMGTCAGCVLLGKELIDNSNVKLLKLIDMKVARNAFGRQKQSFESYISIKGFKENYCAVFIRAPAIKEVWGDCKILSEIKKNIIMVRQDNLIALSFHPELTDDLRIHKYFLDMF
jgi:5'-phosphate synthase pdxT subunit